MTRRLTNDEFLKRLKDNEIKDIPLNEYNGMQNKIEWLCHKNNNHIYLSTPANVLNGKGCPYCSHRVAFVGETDLWTTRPDVAMMLNDKDEGYKYTSGSGKKEDWICPSCKKILKDIPIQSVCRRGLCCHYCSDGVSFPEKFVANMLSQLNCDFAHNKTIDWSENKQYDFYIESMSLIIETHGMQHYENGFLHIHSDRRARSVEEEKANDEYKRNIAKSNGIKYYVELDCRYSDFEYVKKSILDSYLNDLFDLSLIDWNECNKATTISNIVVCSDLWNSGMKNTSDIADYTGLNICTVISYLKKAKETGLCDYVKYNRKINKLKSRNVLCVETGKVYECGKEIEDDGYSKNYIYDCCGARRETAYGMHWQFI